MNKINENYIAKCVFCGGELSPDDKICPYCNQDLTKLNEEYVDKEKQIKDAIKKVDDAKRHLHSTNIIIEENSYKKSKERKKLILLFIVIGIVIAIVACALIGTAIENATDKKIEGIEQDLLSQNVGTIELPKLSEEDRAGFEEMDYRSPVGHMYQNDKYYKISFFSDSNYNSAKYTTTLIFDKFEFDTVTTFDENYFSASTDGAYIIFKAENSIYNKNATDVLTITDYTMDDVERLDDVVINDIVFQCYRQKEEYYLIANPYPDFFITFEIHLYDENNEIIEEYNNTHNTQIDTSLTTLPLEVFNKLRNVDILME